MGFVNKPTKTRLGTRGERTTETEQALLKEGAHLASHTQFLRGTRSRTTGDRLESSARLANGGV